MTTDNSGTAVSSGESGRFSAKYLLSLCDGVNEGKVTPLVTSAMSEEQNAWNATVEKLFKRGLIRLICWYVENPRYDTEEDTILNLRAAFPQENVLFSVRSLSRGRKLIYAWYSKKTDEPPLS